MWSINCTQTFSSISIVNPRTITWVNIRWLIKMSSLGLSETITGERRYSGVTWCGETVMATGRSMIMMYTKRVTTDSTLCVCEIITGGLNEMVST
ncbi:hypothetical protein GIB67_023557 [Kingdonia uniflora]|uniref:Uncharacterized protein n=1 Tax=Kingdonia uniflora TaxID=39325 RepID=A0A7J7PA32_9MAGN|nr:hypothetical protein GIB67_023557 [Kingdonia uniflora]